MWHYSAACLLGRIVSNCNIVNSRLESRIFTFFNEALLSSLIVAKLISPDWKNRPEKLLLIDWSVNERDGGNPKQNKWARLVWDVVTSRYRHFKQNFLSAFCSGLVHTQRFFTGQREGNNIKKNLFDYWNINLLEVRSKSRRLDPEAHPLRTSLSYAFYFILY